MALRIRLFRTRVILMPALMSLVFLYSSVQLVMIYWVSTVSDFMVMMWGVISITDVSSFLTIRLTVHTCKVTSYLFSMVGT